MTESGPNRLGASLPSLEEAQRWVGFRVDEMGGSSVGRVQAIYVDQDGGEPEWVILKVGRFGKLTAVPFRDCAPGAGHLWAARTREAIRGAPAIEAGGPLTRETELELCAHFGIGEGQGRAAALADRPEGVVTSHPPAVAEEGS